MLIKVNYVEKLWYILLVEIQSCYWKRFRYIVCIKLLVTESLTKKQIFSRIAFFKVIFGERKNRIKMLSLFFIFQTDDQILLLQNCWCELLALTLCWKSLQLTNEIIFFHGQAIDLEKACSLDLGEMFTKMSAVVEQFRRLKVDQYECVALKVIILICPGM